jgi:putative salt-induced outer membrane protein YdiY
LREITGRVTAVLLLILCVGVLHSLRSDNDFLSYESNETQKQDTTETKPRNPWDIKAGLGINITGGNSDSRTLTFDSEFRKQWSHFRYRGIGRRAYGTTSYSGGPRIPTTDNWLASSRLDLFTTVRRLNFFFLFLSVDGNQFRGYWAKRTSQLGYGVQLFPTVKKIDLNIALGVDYSKDHLVVKGSRRDEIFSVVLKPEIDWEVTQDLSFGHKVNMFVDLQDEREYQIDSHTIITLRLSGKLSLRSTYLLNYKNNPRLINEVDESGKPTGERVPAKPSDHTFSTSIVLNF